MENLGNAVQKRKQVVDLTTLSDRLGSLEHLVRQHSDQLPPARPPRAKYATACVISDQGLHKPEKGPKEPKFRSEMRYYAVPYGHVEPHVA